MAIVTLLSDFGLSDSYVGQMKGVLLSLAPDARLVDLTHNVPPQNVVAGALHLAAAIGCFPQGSVHLAVVDPGVGSARAAIAARAGGHLFVGPDNGLLMPALDRLGGAHTAHRLENPAWRPKQISRTFHGRDIFAPAAGHLAAGDALSQAGPETELQPLDLPQAQVEEGSVRGEVLYLDHFGNAITNIPSSLLPPDRAMVAVAIGREPPIPVADTFADVNPGRPVAYPGSAGRLEIAVRNGSAARELTLQPGSRVLLRTSA